MKAGQKIEWEGLHTLYMLHKTYPRNEWLGTIHACIDSILQCSQGQDVDLNWVFYIKVSQAVVSGCLRLLSS